MPEITANDVSLHYTDSGGDGRPVVLIHGWPLSGASWSEQVPALTDAGYRVITYDRRGFGDSEKPEGGYDYDTLTADLAGLLDGLDLTDASLVGFSMGGGEVARYVGRHGTGRLHSVVFAAAVPPYLLKTDDNPDGGLEESGLQEMEEGARTDRANFLDGFTTAVFTAGDKLKVTEEQRQQAIALQQPAREEAVVGRIGAFGRTDFREDLPRSTSRPCPVELRRYSASIVHLTTPSAFVLSGGLPRSGLLRGRGPGTTTRAIRRVGFTA